MTTRRLDVSVAVCYPPIHDACRLASCMSSSYINVDSSVSGLPDATVKVLLRSGSRGTGVHRTCSVA